MTTPNLGFPEIEIGMWHRGKEATYNELVSMLDTGLSGIFGDADLVAIAALAGTGIAVRTASDTWALRTLAAPAAGFTITNPAGIAGNPTFVLSDDLAALEGLGSTGIAVRSAANTWVQRTIVGPAAGLTVTNGNGVSGNPTFALANDLAALEALASTGLAVRSGTDTWVQRTITGTTEEITVTNGNGVSGNPTISLPTTINLAGKTIRDSDSGIIEFRGNNTGITNIVGWQFQKSDGTLSGFVGEASNGNEFLYLISYLDEIKFLCNGTANIDYSMSETAFEPGVTSSRNLGSSSLTWQHVYAEGVQFPATQVASANANNLDDYEEGTWTPTLTFATPGTLVVAYSSRAGRYTKVGRIVQVEAIAVTITFTLGTATGQMRITGQPFSAGLASTTTIGYFTGFTPGADTQVGSLVSGAALLFYHFNNATGGGAVLDHTDAPTGVQKQIYVSAVFSI